MLKIGYHASHEQFKPSLLLNYAMMAEEYGFDAVHSSDHFHPWNERQGESGFSFAWLGAAMQATKLPFGLVCAPGQRYHPAIVAQAIATLGEMFPERFWISLGSGEAINESITGDPWPEKSTRNTRLLESYEIIQRLLNGETVSSDGIVHVDNATLYTRPTIKPLVIGAAVSKETAGWMGGWADGLITVNKPYEELKEVVEAFRAGGGEGKPLFLKVQLSYASTKMEAVRSAYDQWRTNVIDNDLLADLSTVEEFEKAASSVLPEDLYSSVCISADLEEHLQWIKEYYSLGFSTIILHNVNRNQERFIKDFGSEVLPKLDRN